MAAFLSLAHFLSLARDLQLLVCAYCDEVTNSVEYPMRITLYADGFQMRLKRSGHSKFEFLPTWMPVEVRFFKLNGTLVTLRNDKMHQHEPFVHPDVAMLCEHVLVPVPHQPDRFEYRDVDTWWLAPTSSRRATFPCFLSNVLSYSVRKNGLREFVR